MKCDHFIELYFFKFLIRFLSIKTLLVELCTDVHQTKNSSPFPDSVSTRPLSFTIKQQLSTLFTTNSITANNEFIVSISGTVRLRYTTVCYNMKSDIIIMYI